MRAALAPAVLGVALLAACQAPPVKPKIDAAKVVDQIRSDEVGWNADWKSGDAGKVTAHYALDATVMDPGEAPVKGAEAIRASVQKTMDDPAFTLSFSSEKVDVAASGDLAVSRGTYNETFTDPGSKAKTSQTGTFVTVYKPQADGAWKATWDIAAEGPAPGK